MIKPTRKLPLFPGYRDSLEHFAGRERELGELQHCLDCILSDQRRSESAVFKFVTGMHGVGKSELIRRFILSATEDESDATPLVKSVDIPPGMLRYPVETLLTIAKASDHLKDGQYIASRGLSFPWMMHELADRWRKDRCGALIVVVDEVQRADDDCKEVIGTLCSSALHCPVLVLLAGLERGFYVLSGLGIDAWSNRLRLEPLSSKECRRAIKENLAYYADVQNVDESIVEALVDLSFCQPVHIRSYLEIAVNAVVEHGSNALDDMDIFKDVIEQGGEERERYCDERLRNMDPLNRLDRGSQRLHPLASYMARLPKDASISMWKAIDLCSGANSDGTVIVQNAIRHSVLKIRDGRVSFGLPSMRRYMTDRLIRHRYMDSENQVAEKRNRKGGVSYLHPAPSNDGDDGEA